MNAIIGIMTRLPEPGRVKTRLIPALGPEGACQVHCHLLRATLTAARATGLPVELFITGNGRLAPEWSSEGERVHRQVTGGLGRRMQHALARLHARAPRALLVGSDCPELSPDYLLRAAGMLGDRDFVLGPAVDGGYVLLGSARPSFWTAEERLGGVALGTDRALEDTARVLEPAGSVGRLPPVLRDLDEPADLMAIFSSGEISEILNRKES